MTRGMYDMMLRSLAATTSPAQQRQMAEQRIHASLPKAELVSFKLSNAALMQKPMQVEMKLRVPGALVRTGRYRLLRTAVISGALGVVEGTLPRLLGALPTRKYTLDARVTFQYDEDETVKLPAGMRVVALPNTVQAKSAVSALTVGCKRDGNRTLSCHRSFQLKSRFIRPHDYAGLRAAVAKMGRVAHQPVILLSSDGKAR